MFFTDQNAHDVLFRVLFQFFYPFDHILIGRSSSNIEDNQSSRRAFIIGVSNGSKALLTGSIPDLRFDFIIFQGDHFGCKLYSNRRLGLLSELVSFKS